MDRPIAVAAGHICLDVTPVFPPEAAGRAGTWLQPGSLTQVGRAELHTGGAVANTGLAMRRFGVEVRLLGKVGRDPFGALVRRMLEEDGGAQGLVEDPESDTSYSVVLSPPGMDRIFLHNPGANATFGPDDIAPETLEGACWFHFGYPPLMERLYRNAGQGLEAVLRKAREAGLAVSLDLAAVDPTSEAGKEDWRTILGRVLPLVDVFVPSWEELCFMIARPRYAEVLRRAGGGEATAVLSLSRDVEPLAEEAVKLGAKNLLLKCGAAGFYYRTGGADALSGMAEALGRDMTPWVNLRGFQRSYRPARVLSGTGAGDSTIAAFLAALLRGWPPEDCLRLAAATGASCVEAYDALGGLLPLEEQEKRIRAGLETQDLLRP